MIHLMILVIVLDPFFPLISLFLFHRGLLPGRPDVVP